MSVKIDTALRRRICRMCDRTILPGEKHLRFSTGGGQYAVDNICKGCLWTMAFKLVFNIDVKLPAGGKRHPGE